MQRIAARGATLAITGLLFFCGGASAANLLTNGGFNANVSGWTPDAGASVIFSAIDASSNPGSGSAQVTNASPTPSNGLGISQCGGSVSAGANYTYGGKVLYPTGQGNTGSLQVGIRWLAGANCTGATVGSQPRLSVNTPLASFVSLASTPVQAPVGAVSVLFLAFPSKVEAGGSLIGRFDDLYVDDGVTPGPGAVTSIPTLDEWALGLLAMLLALLGARSMAPQANSRNHPRA